MHESWRRIRGGAVNYTLYYHAEFSQPLKDYGVWSATLPTGRTIWKTLEFAKACAEAAVLPGCREKEGQHLGFYANFPTTDKEVIMLKAGISYVSLADARENIKSEIPDWDFNGLRQQSHDVWADELGRMSIEGGTKDQKTTFYTALYHSLLDPRTETDVNENYPGGDGQVHQAKGFTKRTIFSGWDIYWSQFPLLTLIDPQVVDDEIQSMVELATQNGTHYFDRWELMGSYTGCMCGSPQVVVNNDAYQKGIRNFDVAKAYEYSVNTCRKFGNGPLGYTPGAVAVTLENAFADWNLSQLAKALGHVDEAKTFATDGQDFRNIFNPELSWTYDKSGKDAHPEWHGWFVTKDKDGKWGTWNGLVASPGEMESSLYQNGWFVPQDIPALISLLGGKKLLSRSCQTSSSARKIWARRIVT